MHDFGILLILGIGIFGGMLGATLFQKARFPQVAGYIIIGLVIGQTGLEIIDISNIDRFTGINDFALGIIGFLVGGELQLTTFKKYGKQFAAILLGEGLLAFVLVSLGTTLFLKWIIGEWDSAIAAGIIFGAIASATDPASTVSCLWENRSKGILTTSIIAIVALDDALAMTLYGIASAVSKILSNQEGSISHELFNIFRELGGAMVAGAIFAFILNSIIRKMPHEKNLVLTIGVLLLTIGIAKQFHLDVILGTMTLGFVLINKAPRQSEEIFSIVRIFSAPIYVIFFVLVGARIDLFAIPPWLWVAASIYVITRSTGKLYGARFGAKVANVDPLIQKYLGYSLFAQGGIAIGLAIISSEHLNVIPIEGDLGLGDIIVFGVTASTLIVQFLGPAMTKRAIYKSGENDKDVTEEDVIKEMLVKDVAIVIKPINQAMPLTSVMERFTQEDILSLPVVNKNSEVVGIISLEDMKELLTDQASWMWILTADVMTPIKDTFYLSTPLEEACTHLSNISLDQVPILNTEEDRTLAGLFNSNHTKACISRELLKRQGEVVNR